MEENTGQLMPYRKLLSIAAFLTSLVCVLSVVVNTSFAAGATADGLGNVRLTLVNGSSIKTTIEAVDQNGLVSGQNIPANLKFDQILTIDTKREIGKPDKDSVKVYLVDGGLLYGKSVTVKDDRIEIGDGKTQVNFPLDVVRAVIWNADSRVSQLRKKPSVEDDTIVVKTNRGQQFVGGLLESIDETHVHVNYEGKSRKISRNIVQAVVTADLKIKKPQGAKLNISTSAGGLWVGTLESIETESLMLNLSGGHQIGVSLSDICRIAVDSDRVVYLSDLQPSEVEQSSLFAAARKWKRNTSVTGSQMQMRFHSTGRVVSFDRGLGTKPYSLLAFENENDFDQFRAIVGIDMDAQGRGDCEMIVRGDGIQLWAKRVRGSDDPDSIVIDISGVKKISLIVLPGEGFDLGDHANWADAKFMKSK